MCPHAVQVVLVTECIRTLAAHERVGGTAKIADKLDSGVTVKGDVRDIWMHPTSPRESSARVEECMWRSIRRSFGNVICFINVLYKDTTSCTVCGRDSQPGALGFHLGPNLLS